MYKVHAYCVLSYAICIHCTLYILPYFISIKTTQHVHESEYPIRLLVVTTRDNIAQTNAQVTSTSPSTRQLTFQGSTDWP